MVECLVCMLLCLVGRLVCLWIGVVVWMVYTLLFLPKYAWRCAMVRLLVFLDCLGGCPVCLSECLRVCLVCLLGCHG